MTKKRFLVGALLVTALIGALVLFVLNASPSARLKAVQLQIRMKYNNVEHLGTDSVAAELAEPTGTKMVILDVRTPEEYAISHLKNARLIDTDLDPATALAGIPKETEIVVYCSVGYRSSEYARKLQSNHYTHVYNLDGSIFKWANEGRPLYDEYKQVTVVHPYNAEWGLLLQPQCRADLSALKK